MDNFTTLANSILKENILIQEQSNDLMVSVQSGRSFGDFLRSLTGKTVKDVLDSASYSRLYAGNKFGMTSAANDESNPEVLLSNFLTKLGNFVNKDVMKHRPRIAETEEFKKKHNYDEYLEQEKERIQLFKDLIRAEEGPEKDALRRKKNAFRNTSEYAEAMRLQNKKEDAAVEKFHNTPIEQGELVNDGSQEFKDLEKMYNQIQSMRSGNVEIEDQESGIRSLDGFFSDEEAYIEDQEVDMNTVEKGLMSLAATASSGAKGIAGKILGTKAQAAKASLDKRAKAVAKAIPAYDAVTKKLEQGYKELLKTANQ